MNKKYIGIAIILVLAIGALLAYFLWDDGQTKSAGNKPVKETPNPISEEILKQRQEQEQDEWKIIKEAKKTIKPLEPIQVEEPKPEVKTPAPQQTAYSTEHLNWGYSSSKNGLAPKVSSRFNTVLTKLNAIYFENTSQKTVFLTFDEGYENGYTPAILDVLKQQQVPAAFFVTGPYITKNPALVKRMDDEGHIIGNHTWHHYNMYDLTDEEIKKELDYVKIETNKIIGENEMRYMRPPTGAFSEASTYAANQLGYQSVFWSLAYKDWVTTEQKGWQYAYDSVMGQMHPGAIILLHAVSSDNAEALDKIITDLKAQGYIFKSLDQYGK